MSSYAEKCDALEAEAESLAAVLTKVKEMKGDGSWMMDPQIQALKTENSKLQYRINILKRHAEELGGTSTDSSNETILKILDKKFTASAREIFPEINILTADVTRSSNAKFGDYQCNCAMSICQTLKNSGQKVSSRNIGEQIASRVTKDDIIESLEVAGPGFINVSIKTNFLSDRVTRIILEGVHPPPVKKKKVVVDFSSPNIAKEMHVGHLRSTIIGESISRLLEYLGHDVLRLNHIGDWGTQFGMLIAHLENMFPNYHKESPSIKDLQAFYKEAKLRFDSDEEFKKQAYNCVVKLQQYDPKIINAWKLICDVSREEIQAIYDRLDITLTERGESFYQSRMKELVADLERTVSKDYYYEDDGRRILFYPEHSIPLIIVKSDGGYTYDTSDLAALKQRIFEEKADWIVYVVDAGQAVHFDSIFLAAKKLGWITPEIRVDHVEFGVVRGEDKKKFKTRSGDTVKLANLLDEGLSRALQKLHEKKRDEALTSEELKTAQEAVAYGCIKYADLCHNRTSDYVFSFDKMLDDKGNTAVYLLYALTRIRSIARSANVSQDELLSAAKKENIKLEHPKEVTLAKMLVRFSEIIVATMEDLFLNRLCEYLYELSSIFSEFYDNCYCIVKDKESGQIKEINISRLLLCEATARVMMQGFQILGLQPVHRM